MKNALQTVGIRKDRGMKNLLVAIALTALTAPAAMAQSASGNGGADAIIDGIEALAPVVALIIAACVSLGFLTLTAVVGYKLIRKFF